MKTKMVLSKNLTNAQIEEAVFADEKIKELIVFKTAGRA